MCQIVIRIPDVWYPKEELDLYLALQHNAPVSTILLQENSLKPAKQAGFFFAFGARPGTTALVRRQSHFT
ncbi:MAG: hypothetical protein EOO78_00050 [Oxalobacteraceae bacterium]|nr:MAG: hypothetical protein EOO78_00050 [Oxalobacteraceae bacterium]